MRTSSKPGVKTEAEAEALFGLTRSDLINMESNLRAAIFMICGPNADVQASVLVAALAWTLLTDSDPADDKRCAFNLASAQEVLRFNYESFRKSMKEHPRGK